MARDNKTAQAISTHRLRSSFSTLARIRCKSAAVSFGVSSFANGSTCAPIRYSFDSSCLVQVRVRQDKVFEALLPFNKDFQLARAHCFHEDIVVALALVG